MRTVKLAAVFLLLGTMIYPQENSSPGGTEWDEGIIKFRSEDGKFSTRFDVRIFLDGAYFPNDTLELLSNGTHLRKGRFAMKVKLWENWRAEWDIDIADATVEIKDMWVSYNGFRNSFIKIGHFKVPFGHEILTSSRYQTFVERAMPNLAFKVGRRSSIGYTKWGRNWNFSASLFGQELLVDDKNKAKDETGGGFGSRFVFAPILTNSLLIHTGASLVEHAPNDNGSVVDFTSEPETKIGDIEMLDTDNVFNVEKIKRVGLEGALRLNNISLQGEIMQADLIRFAETDTTSSYFGEYKNASFSGGYVYLSLIITGEKRPWDNTQGEFSQIIPKSNKIGAWEVLARISNLDLSDTEAIDPRNPNGILGGKANNITLGLTWYANPNIKFMLNYMIVDNSTNATGDGAPGDYDFHAMALRALIAF